ncbi:MAG TPA: histidine kinase dimerization/phosphoacceptor domain -containing protein, partial [Polyangiaceae bacterium]|nr:histidine kinase dimerization/phosphoacceptor domain -containing protein [Polyangiaceae bacterium]
MARKLERLPAAVRSALGSFACLGISARTRTLSLVYGTSEAGVHEALQDAVVAGLVLRSADGYAFLHDRVQEAAYAMILEQDRAAEHLRIGTLLATHTLPDDLADNIFEIVNHLDRGALLIEDQEQRDRAAELNRIAGQRAKASNAHAAARRYFAAGAALLGADGWQRNFKLAFELELQLADCEFMTADLQVAEQRLERLGKRATSLTDRAAVIYVLANLYTAMVDRADRAVEICLDYLRVVGIEWSAHPSAETIQSEYQALLARLADRSIDELLDLPLVTDPDTIATIEVLLGLFTPAFNTDRGLVALVLLRIGNLGLEHGNTDATSLGYAFLGMVLGSGFGDYRTGFLFGKLARDLVEQRGLVRYRGRIYHTLGTHVLAWTQPIAVAEASLRRGLSALQEVGDVTYVSFAHLCLVTLVLGRGAPLESVQREAEDAFAIVQRGKFDIAIDGLSGQLRLVRALRGQLPDPCSLDDGCGLLADYTRLGLTRGWHWIRTMQACFIYGNWQAARAAEQRAAALIAYSASFLELAEYHFFAALTLAACFTDATDDERAELRTALVRHRQLLAGWAENCSENFAYRVALVDAELARIEADPLKAMDAYENAIRLAREQNFAHAEAIALEVAARFYAARGFDTFARAYTLQARSAYLRWGAVGKVEQLDRLQETSGEREPERPVSAIHAPSTDLDLATMVKTSQAVTAEVGLEKLIETLMAIALEHAGAERGLLILPRAGELQIEAEATTEGDAGVSVRLRQGIARHPELPETILHYVSRTQELVLLDDAQSQHAFSSDPYLRERRSRSVVCVPLVKQAELIGVLYLENRLAAHVFTNTRIAVLKLLASQAATSLENASLEQENATLAEKQSLLKEVHHRVKNNLQLISSLLNLQASRIKDPAVAELFADSRNRVRSMALVHENLYRAGNFAKIPMANHLRALCAELTRAYVLPGGPLQLAIDVGDLHLDMNRAMACGLIVNELVSNALKHAFPSGRVG